MHGATVRFSYLGFLKDKFWERSEGMQSAIAEEHGKAKASR